MIRKLNNGDELSTMTLNLSNQTRTGWSLCLPRGWNLLSGTPHQQDNEFSWQTTFITHHIGAFVGPESQLSPLDMRKWLKNMSRADWSRGVRCDEQIWISESCCSCLQAIHNMLEWLSPWPGLCRTEQNRHCHWNTSSDLTIVLLRVCNR